MTYKNYALLREKAISPYHSKEALFPRFKRDTSNFTYVLLENYKRYLETAPYCTGKDYNCNVICSNAPCPERNITCAPNILCHMGRSVHPVLESSNPRCLFWKLFRWRPSVVPSAVTTSKQLGRGEAGSLRDGQGISCLLCNTQFYYRAIKNLPLDQLTTVISSKSSSVLTYFRIFSHTVLLVSALLLGLPSEVLVTNFQWQAIGLPNTKSYIFRGQEHLTCIDRPKYPERFTLSSLHILFYDSWETKKLKFRFSVLVFSKLTFFENIIEWEVALKSQRIMTSMSINSFSSMLQCPSLLMCPFVQLANNNKYQTSMPTCHSRLAIWKASSLQK